MTVSIYLLFLLKVLYLLLCIYLNWRWSWDKLLSRALVMMVITMMSVASHAIAFSQNHAYTKVLWSKDELACLWGPVESCWYSVENASTLHRGETIHAKWVLIQLLNNELLAGLWRMNWILTALPEDVALQIMDHLSPLDRVACSLVCKAWHCLATGCIRSISLKASNNTDVTAIEDWLARSLKGQQSSLQTLVWQCEECHSCCCRTTPFMDLQGASIYLKFGVGKSYLISPPNEDRPDNSSDSPDYRYSIILEALLLMKTAYRLAYDMLRNNVPHLEYFWARIILKSMCHDDEKPCFASQRQLAKFAIMTSCNMI